jgi:hypothetical protein
MDLKKRSNQRVALAVVAEPPIVVSYLQMMYVSPYATRLQHTKQIVDKCLIVRKEVEDTKKHNGINQKV